MEVKCFVSYITAYNYLVQALKNRKKLRGNLNVRHIVITPDRYTLSLEKMLMNDLNENGSFDVSVMTFDRLLYNEGSTAKYLSRYGGAMLIRKIIDENKNEQGQKAFLCFNRVMLKGSFPSEMYDTIMQLKSCLITPEFDINTDKPHLNNKLNDIKYIYKKYEEFLDKNQMADSGAKLNILQHLAYTSDYIKNAYFYFYGFDSLTPQAYSLIKTLSECSMGAFLTAVSDGTQNYPSVDISSHPEISALSDFHKHIYTHLNNRDNVQFDSKVPINIYRANSRSSMLIEACRIITQHIRKGGKFCDIALVGNTGTKDLAVLDEGKISYNYDHKVSLSVHPLIGFLKDCIDAVRTHYNNGTAHIAKNFFSGIDYQDACIYENYCLKFNITHSIFNPFTLGQDGQDFETAQKTRAILAKVLKNFEQNLKNSVTVEDYLNCIKTFIEDNQLENKLEKYNSDYATSDFQPYAQQCLDKLNSVLNEARVLSGYRIDLTDFRAMLFAGIDAVEISAIPPSSDAVNITDIEGLRCEQYKVLIYLDCVDGMFPIIDKDLGMLSDNDLDYLNKLNIKIEPKIRQINRRRKFNLIQSLYLGQSLHFLYCKNDNGEDRIEANILNNLRVLFPNHSDFDEDSDNVLLSLLGNSQTDLSRYFYNPASSKKLVYHQYKKAISERLEVLGAPISTAAYALKIDFDPINKQDFDYTIAKDVFYATQLENYFKCPFIYLAQHILKLKKRPEGDINAIDVGNILHSVMEQFVAFSPKDIDECDKIITDIITKIVSENDKLKNNRHFSKMLLNEAILTGRALFDQNQNSDFEILYREKKFGNSGDLPPLEILTDNGTAKIAGKIDRIDQYEDYVRIIDYKSGKISSNASEIFQDIYSGNNLQLLLYMKAVQNGLNKKPFASLYFPINNDFQTLKHPRFCMQGLVSDELKAVLAADKKLNFDNLKSEALPVSIKSVSGQGLEVGNSSSVLSAEEFENTLNYSVSLTKNAIEEISSGYFEPSPCEGSCKWCDYKGVCCQPYENERDFSNIEIKKNIIARLGQNEKE